EDLKGDLNKSENEIGESQLEIDKVKNELANENKKLEDLRAQLSALR
ncbi:MAG: hypothetical protein JNM44_12645, partial [Chitinophagaceae bacterium]|nr:hypothetical protein [Chitinophagaceae bacterium]